MTIAVLVLISITIITLDQRAGTHHLTSGIKSVANDVFSPVGRAFDNVVNPIGDFFAGAVNYRNLQTENNQLRATVGQLRQQQAEHSYQTQQLQKITSLQHLRFVGSLPFTTADVVSTNLSNFDADVQIDKGRSDGIAVGMPIVGNGGLVGVVTQASHSTAIVTLVTDGQSKVGVIFGPSNCTTCAGTVQGQGPGREMEVNYVQPGTSVHNGEVMYSNGQGGALPGGIPVARVASYKEVAGAAQVNIRVHPAADLSDLAYVDVILWEPSP